MDIEKLNQLLSGYETALLGSFAVSLMIIVSEKIHRRRSSRRQTEKEIQRSHEGFTPRIGGIAIFLDVYMLGTHQIISLQVSWDTYCYQVCLS